MLISSRFSPPSSLVSSSIVRIAPADRKDSRSAIPVASLPAYFNVSFAIQHGYFRCVRYLLQLRHDPNERDKQCRTPLILCAYVESDPWSLSLAQNLLEKGAKIALEDQHKRNPMHHACALQRLQLVKLFVSCLDFDLGAKDVEGNTCLHYAAVTGNDEIAELLMRSAERMSIRLDQFVNREGCSAAVLALRYGHVECVNAITHRDWDEFFVIPRPLSIYEVCATTTDRPLTSKTESRKSHRTLSSHSMSKKSDVRRPTHSFGLLNIIFNEGDTGYSTRLADLCHEEKQQRSQRRSKPEMSATSPTATTTTKRLLRAKSAIAPRTHYGSAHVAVDDRQSGDLDQSSRTTAIVDSETMDESRRPHDRMQVLYGHSTDQRIPFRDTSTPEQASRPLPIPFTDSTNTKPHALQTSEDPEDVPSKLPTPEACEYVPKVTVHHFGRESSAATTKKLARSATVSIQLPVPMRVSSRVSSAKTPATLRAAVPPAKKRSIFVDPTDALSSISKGQSSVVESDVTSNYQTIQAGRSLTAVAQSQPSARYTDSPCSIREAKGPKNPYNMPEQLFGLKPSELFGGADHQPKILDHYSPTSASNGVLLQRSQSRRQSHLWQKDMSQIIDLYNIHHCPNYRAAAPLPETELDGIHDLNNGGKLRNASLSRTSSIASKTSTTMPRRNSISRPSNKSTAV